MLRQWLVGLAVAAFAANVWAASAAVEEARRLLEAGQAEAALEAMDAELDAENSPEFDYLYGIAALDAGRAGIAVFAFQRVLAAKPDHVFARAELGRALLQLGEFQEAMEEFRKVREAGAPPEITTKLDEYEARLRAAAGPGYKIAGYAEAFFGYDSNYNSATADGQVSIPAFGDIVFSLDELFQEDESITAGARGGVFFAAPFSERSTFVGGLELEGADYPDANRGFYYVNLRGNLGVRHQIDSNDSFTVAATGFSTWVANLNYLKSIGVLGSWRHEFNQHDAMTAYARISNLHYDEVIDFRDVRQVLTGVTLTRTDRKRWEAGLGLFGGVEIEDDDARRDIGRSLYGARGFVSYKFTENVTGRGSMSGQFSDYRGEDGLFLRTRDDEQFRVAVSLEYKFMPKWSIRPEIRYTDINSNIPTSDYDRFETLVFIRRDFN